MGNVITKKHNYWGTNRIRMEAIKFIKENPIPLFMLFSVVIIKATFWLIKVILIIID